MFNWIADIETLSAVALTVRAQAIGAEDVDRLVYPIFFPNVNAPSVKLSVLYRHDARYVSDFREWNARGRLIPIPAAQWEELEMVPIEGYHKIGEREQQALREQTLNNQKLYREAIAADIPERVTAHLVPANFRRIEVAAFEAWTKGTITARNPVANTTQTVNLGFGSRVQTASTAWDDGGTNAYNDLIAWLEDGETEIGVILGVALRRTLLGEIQTDAPRTPTTSGVRRSVSDLESLISDELGHEFSFYPIEHTVDIFNDGGTATTRTKVFPDGYCVAIPDGITVGATHQAPVLRAMELAEAIPEAGVNIRGNTVYYDHENGGRTLSIECQTNDLPLPNKERVWSIDTGVTA